MPDLLRVALVLCADHELNVSSFTARCVASTGANVAHATLAGLCALQGPGHGLASEVSFELVRRAEERGASIALNATFKSMGSLPGFGHPLYPDGDPRGAALMQQVTGAHPDHPAVRAARELADLVAAELDVKPNVDLGLALLGRVLRFTPEQVLALFALGRTVGWLAHALESAREGQLLRPRAKYTGPLP